MNRARKEQLQQLFEAPKPARKRKFFREIEKQPMNIGHVLWVQFSYICKWSWCLSALLLGGTFWLRCFYEKELLRAILAIMPFLAVVNVSESVRSLIYGMDELEMVARFSMKSVILVRMGIVGIENLLMALIMALFVGGNFFQTVLYLFVPYLLTTFGCFLLVRNISGREKNYYCGGLAMVISGLSLFSTCFFKWIYQARYVNAWMLLVVVLAWMTFCESRKTLRMAESYV